MNDNAELLKFAVENIEEWPEEWTHLRSDDRYNSPIIISGTSWFICSENTWSHRGDRTEEVYGFKTEFPEVITRNEWEEARKENYRPKPENSNTFTKSMLEVGKHIVVSRYGSILSYQSVHKPSLNEDLTSKRDKSADIVEVYQLVWSREDSEKETKRKKLEEEVKKLEQELKLKKEELENANK